MSQIDKVAYIPLLVWFIIFFLIFYFFMFSYFLTYFIITFKTRNNYIEELINFSYNSYYFFNIFLLFCINNFTKNFFNVLYIYFKNVWFLSLTTILKNKSFLIK